MTLSIDGVHLLPKDFHDFYSQDYFFDLKVVVKLDDSDPAINDVSLTSGAFAEVEALHNSRLDQSRWSSLREGSNLNDLSLNNESANSERLPIAESSRANTTESTTKFWEKSCHKIILSQNSPLMKAILIKAWYEVETKSVEENAEAFGKLYHATMDQNEGRRFLRLELKDVAVSSVEAILGLIYTGELRIEAKNFRNLIQDAKKLEFSSIVQLCQKHLTQKVDISNWQTILLCAHHADDEKAIIKCFNFIKKQFFQPYSASSVSDVQLSFLQLTYPILLRLVESDYVIEAYAQTVCELIVAWVDADKENRSKNMLSLMQPKVHLLPFDFLFELGRNETIRGDDPTFKLVMNTLLSKQPPSPSTPSSSDSLCSSFSSSKTRDVFPNTSRRRQSAGAAALQTHAVTSTVQSPYFESSPSTSMWPEQMMRQSNDETLLLLSEAGFEVFDRPKDSWSEWETDPMKDKDWSGWEVQLVGDKLIFMGGIDSQEKQTRLYDLTKGIWISGPEMNFKRIWSTSCVVNDDTILVVGRSEAGRGLLLCETLQIPQDLANISDCKWKKLPGTVQGAWGCSVASVNSQAFVMGGVVFSQQPERALSSVGMFDCRSLQWKRVRDMTEPRMHFTTATYQDMIYVFGGTNGFNGLSTCERYHPSLDMWTPISNLPSPIGRGVAGLLGNRITVVCGENSAKYQERATFIYDIETDKWIQGSATVCQHRFPRCFAVKKSHLSSISLKKPASLSLETI